MNVWRPVAPTTGKLPVIVWIYGGGYINGGSSPPTYDGSEFARQGLVFVSFNYRLGRFGFFAHPALTAENQAREPLGNYAYMDQLAALRWVRANVAAFGGDPQQVTLIGESAGGGSVHAMLTASDAKGLFRRAVIQSGGGRGGLLGQRQLHEDRPKLPSGEQVGINFAATLGIQGRDAAALARLRALSPTQVVAGFNLATMFAGKVDGSIFAGPMVDGRIITGDPDAQYATGRFNKADLMVGATSDDIGGDRTMGEPARYVSRLFAQQGLRSYSYRFSYVAESMRGEWHKGAPHASDIPYFFNTVAAKYGAALTPQDAAMGRMTATYLANFARSGDPNGAGLPHWPRQTAGGDEMLDLAASGKPVGGKDPRKAQVDAAEAEAKAAVATAGAR
jgi:para-nitrobenzyl esterase